VLETDAFGGVINALAANGYAAGATYQSAGGEKVHPDGTVQPHTVPQLWQHGERIALESPKGYGASSSDELVAVNDQGFAAGVNTVTEKNVERPVAWTPQGVATLLETPADSHCHAWSISDDHIVVGSAYQQMISGDSTSTVPMPIRWTNWDSATTSTLELLPMPDSQPRPDDFPGLHLALTFVGVTEGGSVLAEYSSHLGQSAYFYDGGKPTQINQGFDVNIYAMNRHGVVVGAIQF